MASANAFNMAYVIKYGLQLIAGCHIPLNMLTETRLVFDIYTKASTTTEKQLKIDLQNLQSSYKK